MRVMAMVTAGSTEERDELLTIVKAGLAAVRAEEGCLAYQVFTSGSRAIVFDEEWADGQAMKAHAAGQPFTTLMAAIEERGLTDSFRVLPLAPVA